MRAANRELTVAGAIVVASGAFPHAADQKADEVVTNEQKAVHLREIGLADRVLSWITDNRTDVT
jgi:hypothetical protein